MKPAPARSTSIAALAVLLLAGCSSPDIPDMLLPIATVDTAFVVSDVIFPDLVVDVHYQEGHPPSQAALSDLARALANTTDKRSIRINEPRPFTAAGPPDGKWSRNELHKLADRLYSNGRCCAMATGEAAILQVIYVGGELDDGHIAFYRDLRIFMFPEPIHRQVANIPAYAEIAERNVLIHEMGHALGLVAHGAPMLNPRLHPEDDAHSTNRESVMYPNKRSASVLNLTRDFERREWFDADDLADVAAYKDLIRRMSMERPAELRALRDMALRP